MYWSPRRYLKVLVKDSAKPLSGGEAAGPGGVVPASRARFLFLAVSLFIGCRGHDQDQDPSNYPHCSSLWCMFCGRPAAYLRVVGAVLDTTSVEV